MAYNQKEQYEKALKVIEDKKLFFIEDIIALLPISKPTFYDFFQIDSNELNTIKEKLEYNRVEVKSSMRSKWYESEAPALQIALMKMIATDAEAHRLNGSKVINENVNKNIAVDLTEEGNSALIKELEAEMAKNK